MGELTKKFKKLFLPKKGNEVSVYGPLDDRLELFVTTFVQEFETKLNFHHLILTGELKENDLPDSYTEKLLGYAGAAVSGAATLCFIQNISTILKAARFGQKSGGIAGEELNTKIHKSKRLKNANVLWSFIKLHAENKIGFRQELIKAALEIFQSFEHQFRYVHNNREWMIGIKEVAQDGAHRAINHCSKQGDDEIDISKIKDMASIKSVTFGKSKYSNSYAQLKLTYEAESKILEWTSSSLYEKPGIVIGNKGLYSYYEKDSGKVEKYGYRRLLSSENWNDIKSEYKLSSNNPFQKYVYELVISDDIVNKLLKRIDSENLTEERVKGIMVEVRDSILHEISDLKTLIANSREEDSKILTNIMDKLEHLNIAKYLNEYTQKVLKSINELSLKTDTNQQELLKSDEKTREDIQDAKQQILDKIEGISTNSVQNEPIWFEIEPPVNLFTGRETELNQLMDIIGKTTKRLLKIIIAGLGGMGKTQLARQLIEIYAKDHYENLIWINSETEAELTNSFSVLAIDHLEIKIMAQDEEKKMEVLLGKVYKILSKRDTLVIFDNVEDNVTYKKFFQVTNYPGNKKLHALITTRYQEWGPGVKIVRLLELPRPDAVLLVKIGLEIEDDSQDKEIERLLDQLQNFPLCIVQAVAYIRDRNTEGEFSLTDYLTEFEINAKKLLDSEKFKEWIDDDPYRTTTYTTWEITTERMGSHQSCGKIALQVLDISYLAPQNIKRETFLELAENSEEHLGVALRLLISHSMINSNKEKTMLSVHKLVQDVTRHHIEKDAVIGVMESACRILTNLYELKGAGVKKDGVKAREALPHFESLLNHIMGEVRERSQETKGPAIDVLSQIISELTFGYHELGESRRIRQILTETLKIQEEHYGLDSYTVALSYANLGETLGKFGEHGKGKELLERALRIMKKYFCFDHLENSAKDDQAIVAATLMNLGNAYGGLGDIEKQKEFLERALAIKERLFDSNHSEVAIALTNLACAYWKLGEFSKQKELVQRALIIFEECYGPNHYLVGVALTNLGIAYGGLKEFKKQKEILERALAIKENHYGPNHYEVALTLADLGVAYGQLGDVEKEKEIFEKALIMYVDHYGPEHFRSVGILSNLAIACGSSGDFERQKELLERIVSIYEKHYGPDHYEVAKTLIHLCAPCKHLGDVQKQREALEKALPICEKHFGADHLAVAEVLMKLGDVYEGIGEIEKKKESYERILSIEEKHHGPNHIEVANTLSVLGKVYKELGEHEKEMQALEKALIIEEENYSLESLEVGQTLVNLGNTYISLGQIEMALDFFQRALIILEQHSDQQGNVNALLLNIGNIYGALGYVDTGKEFLERALIVREQQYGSEHPQLINVLTSLGKIYSDSNDLKKANELFERAALIVAKQTNEPELELEPGPQ